MNAASDPEILTTIADGVGRITLNRPRAINALSYGMVVLIADALRGWRSADNVSFVVLDGAGDRGFCAGGDIRALWDNAAAGRSADSLTFFRHEYRLNALIAGYPKPVVALMKGITMGGGIGVAGHASVRVVTDDSRLAMPETRIGFAPDVGGTWLLGRAPGSFGEYLGLGAITMSAADAIEAGFADFYVERERMPQLLEALAQRSDAASPDRIVASFSQTPPASQLALNRHWIDACYAADTVPEIIELLRNRDEDRANAAADDLAALSPTSLAVTLALIRAARASPSLEAALELEYRASAWLIEQPDLREGIRAQVVDKDRSPRWTALIPEAAERALGKKVPDTVF